MVRWGFVPKTAVCAAGLVLAGTSGWTQGATVYRCPGDPVLYTDALSSKEARDRGCRTLDGAPITVIQTPRPRPAAAPSPGGAAAPNANVAAGSAAGGAGLPVERISPTIQRARDADRRAILEGEMRREEQSLADLRREFNGGEPERRGDERNYQKYLDRVSELKVVIARKESDVAALKRELAKLPPP